MNIGNRIKMLRHRRGVTQEELANKLGITAQAVSKWECGTSTPDVYLLPIISAYFGVSIDDLFDLSDEIRMERIQNMLWDVRFLNSADVENEKSFLLDKAVREPDNSEPYEMLANLELHLADEHNSRAEEFALEAMTRNPYSCRGFAALAHAMGGKHVDPRNNYHNALISYYIVHLKQHPDAVDGYAWLISQLIDDNKLEEARHYCELLEKQCGTYIVTIQKIKIALAEGNNKYAREMWEGLEQDYADNWSVQHWIGEFKAQTGDYEGAKESYNRALNLMATPHFTDPIDSLAKICEMDGDFEGAITARKQELFVSEHEWGDTKGESVDCIRREIARLEKLGG